MVTAWVDRKYKGMDFAVKMYLKLMLDAKRLGCKYMTVDILRNSYSKIIGASPVFRELQRFRIDKFVIVSRKDSYKSESRTGEESFEQVVVNLDVLWTGIQWYKKYLKMKSYFSKDTAALQFFDSIEQDKEGLPMSIKESKSKSLTTMLIGVSAVAMLGGVIFLLTKKKL